MRSLVLQQILSGWTQTQNELMKSRDFALKRVDELQAYQWHLLNRKCSGEISADRYVQLATSTRQLLETWHNHLIQLLNTPKPRI